MYGRRKSKIPEHIIKNERTVINNQIEKLKTEIKDLQDKINSKEEDMHWLKRYTSLLDYTYDRNEYENVIPMLIEKKDFDKLETILCSGCTLRAATMEQIFDVLLANDRNIETALFFRQDIPRELRDRIDSVLVMNKLLKSNKNT